MHVMWSSLHTVSVDLLALFCPSSGTQNKPNRNDLWREQDKCQGLQDKNLMVLYNSIDNIENKN